MRPYYGALNDLGQWWDGRDWRNNATNDCLRVLSVAKRSDEDNGHLDGCFTCPRCRKPHFIPDNFDLLCDGCVTTLQTHPNATVQMLEGIREWRAKPRTHPDVVARYAQRETAYPGDAR